MTNDHTADVRVSPVQTRSATNAKDAVEGGSGQRDKCETKGDRPPVTSRNETHDTPSISESDARLDVESTADGNTDENQRRVTGTLTVM